MDKLNQYVINVLDNKDSMDSLIVYKNGSGYDIKKKNPDVFDVRSVAKTVLALCVGILKDYSHGEFNEETLIYPIIKDKIILTNKKNKSYLKEVRVKHLLTHTTGYRDLLLMSKNIDPKDFDKLLNTAINYPLYYKPGEHFLYSNAGYIILAAVMEEYIGYDLFDFINTKLLKPLEISDASWGRYGNYIAGATKLYMSADDLLKIGKLLANNGKYQGKEIVDPSWISTMTKAKFKNDNEISRKYLSEDYYGYGIWISKAGIVFASGTGGQLIVLIPKLDRILVSTNSGPDSKFHRIKKDVDRIIEILMEDR